MADLAVADLMLRQSNRQTGSREQRSWVARRERIPGWRLRQGDRITITFGAISPTVENDQYYGSLALLAHRFPFQCVPRGEDPGARGRCSVGGKSSSVPRCRWHMRSIHLANAIRARDDELCPRLRAPVLHFQRPREI